MTGRVFKLQIVVVFTVLAVLAMMPAVVFAQAAPATAPPPPPKHEDTGELSFVGVSGNASTTTFGLGYETIARPGTWVFSHKLSFVRNATDGEVSALSFLYTPRAEKTLNARLAAFADYGYFRDRFAGVASRNSATAGLSAKIVNSARETFSMDAGIGYLNEHRLAGDNVSTATYSVGEHYAVKLSATADIADDFGVVGTFDHSTDWRVAHTVALTAKLTEIVSLKVSNALRFSHFPAPGFKRTDTVTSIALVAKFKSK